MSARRVVITGGAAGIGRIVGRLFKEQGDQVFICDIDARHVATTCAEEAFAGGCACNVTDPDAVAQTFAKAHATLGGFDVLINTAGTGGPTGKLETLSLADWQACLAVSLDGTFLCSRQVIPHMRAQRSGSIVNFSSTAGLMGYPDRTPYATAKWGVIGLTKSMAMELGSDNIRVNAICPGAVNGERMEQIIKAEADATNRPRDEVAASYVTNNSLQTFVDAEDLAEMIRFITSDAGRRISGQALSVDGHTESIQ